LLQASETPGTDNWGREPERERGLLHTEKDGKVIREQVPTEQGNYYEYYEGVYQALRNNKELPVTADQAITIIRIIEAANKSNQEGKVIKL
jgi:predicted dehydrogenase